MRTSKTDVNRHEGQNVTDMKQTEPVEEAGRAAENGAAQVTENGLEKADVAAIAAERDNLLDQLQRSVAEFANYRRRVDQERVRARELATRGILAQLLPLLDDLQRALGNVPRDQAKTSWVQGVQFIEKKLSALLDREGVTPIDAIGQPFDPAKHEAVATEEGSTQNVVVEVYQTGYMQGEQVLRPAMVKVGDRLDSQA